MKHWIFWLCMAPAFCMSQSVVLPYNPDINADNAITAIDLLEILPIFGGPFSPDDVLIDGMNVGDYLAFLESEGILVVSDTVVSVMQEGTALGQIMVWDGAEWTLLEPGNSNEVLGMDAGMPAWREWPDLPIVPETWIVGCTDSSSCTYDEGATVHFQALCLYTDVCGVCDGPGAIEECGCQPLPEGDCDCDGNQLDALGICGGGCTDDLDGDGLCDDGDDCVGEADVCGVCNGPGDIYECGCTEIPEGDCNCNGGQLDAIGVCGGLCPADVDGDGICDTLDECVGEIDACGVCNGSGPILGCGCAEIPPGDCDCDGNQLDAVGTCGGACLNDYDGDGVCDDDGVLGCIYPTACNYDPSATIFDGSCDFTSCFGCTDIEACNYQPDYTLDNGSCTYPSYSYDCFGNCLLDADGDGVCDELEVFGCTDPAACNFDAEATELDVSCTYPGCTDSTYCNFDALAGCDDGSCSEGYPACIDPAACNFDANAICGGVVCVYPGCTDEDASNYDPEAGCDDESCIWLGCTVELACNYDPQANQDDGGCEFGNCPGCNDPSASNYNPTSTNADACAFEYGFTGAAQLYTAQVDDTLFIQMWGAQGGNGGPSTSGIGGKGGYAEGYLPILAGQTLQLLVGGMGESQVLVSEGGFNGGGGTYATSDDNRRPGAGGGASDIRWQTDTSLEGRLLVAAGGGGSGGYYNSNGGAGGGLSGGTGACPCWNSWSGEGGSQTSGGNGPSSAGSGSFGSGGDGAGNSHGGGGGGGGWYGGGGGTVDAGGGGSSYVGGVVLGNTESDQQEGNGRIVITPFSSF